MWHMHECLSIWPKTALNLQISENVQKNICNRYMLAVSKIVILGNKSFNWNKRYENRPIQCNQPSKILQRGSCN